MLLYLILVTLVGRELVMGSGGEEPPEVQGVLGDKLLSDEHAFKPFF